MKKPILAANWKMHHGPESARQYLQDFLQRYPRSDDRTVIFFPPALSVTATVAAIGSRSDIMVGVQNIHGADQGAFTGEISAVMSREAGARIVLVGHSERRHIFGETDQQCAEKVTAAARTGLTVMLCVGETLEQRDSGQTNSVVLGQLEAALLDPKQVASRLTIAYEPVWAIGTGRNATPADAAAVHAKIREKLKELIADGAARVPILYGGSVNPGNSRDLLAAPGIDGLLVGGASLDPGSWISVVRTPVQ